MSQSNSCGRIRSRLVFLDARKELFIVHILRGKISTKSQNIVKLSTQVDSFSWECEDQSQILAAISNSKCVVWYETGGFFNDKDLALVAQESFSFDYEDNSPHIVTFQSSSILVRRKDGSIIRIGFSPYISIIHKHCMNNENWNNIIRMCYVTNEEPVWATCALLALQNDQLEPLQKALCALGDVERVQYIKKVRSRKRSEVSRCLSSKNSLFITHV